MRDVGLKFSLPLLSVDPIILDSLTGLRPPTDD